MSSRRSSLLLLAFTAFVPARGAQPAAAAAAVVSKDPTAEITVSAEYFSFSRESDFLGFGQTAKASSNLKGSLAGVGLRWSPLAAGSNNSFEFAGRSGSLDAKPAYSLGALGAVNSQIDVKRREFEAGGLYYLGKGSLSFIRYGYSRMEEKLTNTLPSTSPASWAPTTGGIDASNSRLYRRSMSANNAYLGLGFNFASTSTKGDRTTLYGLKIDTDVQGGSLKSNFLTPDGKFTSSTFFSVPHRATLYFKNAGPSGGYFAEAGYRGVANFADKGGVKGYDSGIFGRLGFSVSF
jgi:hypothetical protein